MASLVPPPVLAAFPTPPAQRGDAGLPVGMEWKRNSDLGTRFMFWRLLILGCLTECARQMSASVTDRSQLFTGWRVGYAKSQADILSTRDREGVTSVRHKSRTQMTTRSQDHVEAEWAACPRTFRVMYRNRPTVVVCSADSSDESLHNPSAPREGKRRRASNG